MPLLSARDFPGINSVPDNSGLANGIFTAFQGIARHKEKAELAQKEETARQLGIVASQAQSIRNMPDGETGPERQAALTRKLAATRRLLEERSAAGMDNSLFESIFKEKISDLDSLNVVLTSIATQSEEGQTLAFDQAKKRFAPDSANFQYGGQDLFEDESGNQFYGTSRRNPNPDAGGVEAVLTPLPGNKSKTPQGKLSKVSGAGLTPEGKVAQTQQIAQNKANIEVVASLQKVVDELDARIEREPLLKSELKQAEQAVTKAKQSFDQVDQIRRNNINLRVARQAVIDGAGSGPVESLFPSFKEQTIRLEAAQGRLGLDVVQSTTFGALSKGELDLSKAIALPIGLDEPDLLKWIDDKIAANDRMASYLERQALFLSGTNVDDKPNTRADWIKSEKAAMTAAMESGGVTEADIQQTMRAHGMTRSEVLVEIRRRFESGG